MRISFAVMVLLIIIFLFYSSNPGDYTADIIFAASSLILLCSFFFGMSYVISSNNVSVCILRIPLNSILIKDITNISKRRQWPNSRVWGLSEDTITLQTSSGNALIISPLKKEEFIRCLLNASPKITIDGAMDVGI